MATFAGCLLLRIGNDGPRGRDACQRRIRRPVRNRSRQPLHRRRSGLGRPLEPQHQGNERRGPPSGISQSTHRRWTATMPSSSASPSGGTWNRASSATFLEIRRLRAAGPIVPFATSGGSGLGKAPERMASLPPGATVLPGKLLNGSPSETALRTWVENL